MLGNTKFKIQVSISDGVYFQPKINSRTIIERATQAVKNNQLKEQKNDELLFDGVVCRCVGIGLSCTPMNAKYDWKVVGMLWGRVDGNH